MTFPVAAMIIPEENVQLPEDMFTEDPISGLTGKIFFADYCSTQIGI
jgi:hypothetical protein